MAARMNDFESTGWGSPIAGGRSLLDLSGDIIALVFHIQAGHDPGHPESLRREISLMLGDIDKRGRQYGQAEEDTKAVRYALCALLDETILNSDWAFKDQWAERPLQLEYFGEHMAGERFFDLLERVRAKGAPKCDLLEVFCITLILGFQGKYKLRGGDELQKLILEIVGDIHRMRGGEPRTLSPHWKIPRESAERPADSIPRWVWLSGLASIAFVVLVFVLFKLWLGSTAAAAIARITF